MVILKMLDGTAGVDQRQASRILDAQQGCIEAIKMHDGYNLAVWAERAKITITLTGQLLHFKLHLAFSQAHYNGRF